MPLLLVSLTKDQIMLEYLLNDLYTVWSWEDISSIIRECGRDKWFDGFSVVISSSTFRSLVYSEEITNRIFLIRTYLIDPLV